ncbi:hypothetical protein LEP1GSC034_1009 [Leptospira interrogans str. 2003000735]|uniref:Uncharacterized protein n=2 Tax=Leptospira interrogans TaxID=173 RepID=A0A829DB61_LEPIR|nr:hypothetical protein [Leptospira interrogans]EMY06265.1 hypothetical protein LEP1GSC029_3146 [Leptospira interrogans str. 2002000626]EMY25566.1 hypothetical protein LEP1GSC115_1485 [Leptospira interrogans serovar Australis str. 200703203]EKN89825.1 hypothetical protein LEP1GSC027_3960 [Leptospira interrogans str. 2002000624]EKQ40245.1 hypothetical protein LEP1GSC025_2155 [Leptospira interrogans str. 2002000621]EKQ46167.1 hypothetical protein LEP1GSC026_3154 [Leptospira interrogans str. 2002
MINALPDLKALVGVKSFDLDMNDSVKLTTDKTEFEEFLESVADNALKLIQSWGYSIPSVPSGSSYPRELRRAEVLLVKAEIIEESGLSDVVDPEDFQVGGQNGERRKMRKLTPEERGDKAAQFRNRAYFTLFGKYSEPDSGFA